jgi:Na+/proline symporter
VTEQALWLLAFLGLYWAFSLYWGLAVSRLAPGPRSFFLADRNLPAWIVVAAGTAFAFSGWFFLGTPDLIFRDGLPFAETCLAAITIALGSALFLKRQWMLAKRFGYVTPGEMASHYFGGEGLRLVMAVVALAFAVPFAALQIGASGSVVAIVSDGILDRVTAMWVLTAVVFTYVAFGGLRAAAFVATLQGVLIVAGIVLLGLYAYWLAGGFEGFMRALGGLGAAGVPGEGGTALVDAAALFEIPGVIQFTSGLGVETPAGGLWTTLMILSYGLALMGLTLSPVFSVLAFASRSPKGFATQATWASAGVMGGVLVLFLVAAGLGGNILGAAAPVNAAGLAASDALAAFPPAGIVGGYLAAMGAAAPWFAAILAVAAVAATQAFAAMAASATGTILVRDVYRRYVDPALDLERQRLFARFAIGLVLLAALLLATFAPAAAAALGALALGFGLQLMTVLAAICWLPWVTRPAATVGVVTGMVFVLFTEDLGIAAAAFVGLDLPWGRWPWTIHSGLWGLVANVAVAFVISLISQRQDEVARRRAFHAFLASHAVPPVRSHHLRHVAWAATLAWLFFAIGPGAVIGNSVFGDPSGGLDAWSFGVPSLWAWQLAWWAAGVLLVWFLSYRMGMATMPSQFIELAAKSERTMPPARYSGPAVAYAGLWVVLLAIGVAALLHWSFGP